MNRDAGRPNADVRAGAKLGRWYSELRLDDDPPARPAMSVIATGAPLVLILMTDTVLVPGGSVSMRRGRRVSVRTATLRLFAQPVRPAWFMPDRGAVVGMDRLISWATGLTRR